MWKCCSYTVFKGTDFFALSYDYICKRDQFTTDNALHKLCDPHTKNSHTVPNVCFIGKQDLFMFDIVFHKVLTKQELPCDSNGKELHWLSLNTLQLASEPLSCDAVSFQIATCSPPLFASSFNRSSATEPINVVAGIHAQLCSTETHRQTKVLIFIFFLQKFGVNRVNRTPK